MAAVLTVELEPETAERMGRAARAAGRSEAALAREAVELYLAAQDDWTRSTLAGLEQARAGRGVAHGEVEAWLRSWGTDRELSPPPA